MNLPLNDTDTRQLNFLASTDRERSKQFYVHTLGLTIAQEDQFALVLRLGDSPLRISEVPDFKPQPFTVLGWEVTDIVESATRLSQLGIELVRFPGMEFDSLGLWSPPGSTTRVCWFHDPDGNLLSLSECV